MNAKQEGSTNSIEKLNGLLAWWGTARGLGEFEERFKRFQEFALELQKASAEAAAHEIESIFATREQFIDSMKGLVQSRGPEEVLAAQAAIAETYFTGLAEQAKRWATFAEKTHTCCSEMAREAALAKPSETKLATRPASTREPRQAAE
jgi:hypothetical protein